MKKTQVPGLINVYGIWYTENWNLNIYPKMNTPITDGNIQHLKVKNPDCKVIFLFMYLKYKAIDRVLTKIVNGIFS